MINVHAVDLGKRDGIREGLSDQCHNSEDKAPDNDGTLDSHTCRLIANRTGTASHIGNTSAAASVDDHCDLDKEGQKSAEDEDNQDRVKKISREQMEQMELVKGQKKLAKMKLLAEEITLQAVGTFLTWYAATTHINGMCFRL